MEIYSNKRLATIIPFDSIKRICGNCKFSKDINDEWWINSGGIEEFHCFANPEWERVNKDCPACETFELEKSW